jgi:sugar O-acyltransferase (sialic acid O-acetyltransferase NeuD family)
MIKELFIFGAGGFAKEVYCCFLDIQRANDSWKSVGITFIVDDAYVEVSSMKGEKVIGISSFSSEMGEVVVAIGDPSHRRQVVDRLPKDTKYATLIHPSATVSEFVSIGEGTIICAGVRITTDISIKPHAHFNLNTTIGHDCNIGEFFTASPGVHLSGNCTIGNSVYLGTNSCIKEKIVITDNVIVGMGSVVVKPIDMPGVYVGSPAKLRS